MNIEIICPIHGERETIDLPASYNASSFEGEIKCAPPNKSDAFVLYLKMGGLIDDPKVESVRRPK